MTSEDKFYFVYNSSTGDIRSLSSVNPADNINVNESFIVVTENYIELYQDFLLCNKKMSNYKIDLDSSLLKVVDKFDIRLDSDYNSFYKIPFVRLETISLFDVVLKICSIDNIPHLILTYNGSKKDLIDKKESSITVYATKKDDINVLYESFKFNFEDLNDTNEVVSRISKIDFDFLYSSNLSFYTRKTFKTYGCAFE
jgi:hypothetical protein